MSERPTRYRTRNVLSPRQREVLALIAKGKTNAEIAAQLGIGFESVKTHVSEILTRLNVERREDAVAAWRESQSANGRVRRLVESLWLLASGKALTATVAVVAVTISATIAIALSNRGNTEPAAPDSTAVAPPTATSAAPSPTANVPAGPYPLGTRTGVPLVDAVLAAVEARDVDALFALAEYRETPCVGAGVLAPPHSFLCPNGEPDGTLITIFPANPGVMPRGDPAVREYFALFLADTSQFRTVLDPRLHAVVDDSPQFEPWMDARIIFESGHTATIGRSGVIELSMITDGVLPEAYPSGTTFLLSPPPGASARAANIREGLFEAVYGLSLTDDPATLYGVLPAFKQAYPALSLDFSGSAATVATISVALDRDAPPTWEGRPHRELAVFAIVDASGTCTAGMAAVNMYEQKFLDFGTVRLPPGSECNANAVLAAMGP